MTDTIQIKRPSTQINVPDFVTKSEKEDTYNHEIIKLPTKGWFYDETNPLSSGEIEIRQMSAKHEDLLANQGLIKSGKVLDKLMEALIVNKSIKINEILIPDKNAIFIGIRMNSYGNTYSVKLSCPQCSSENKVDINLGSLNYKPFDFENHPKGQNNFTFRLPNSNVNITYKLLNQIDEKSIDAELETLKKISKENTQEITTRLKYLITSIDGNSDKQSIRKFIDEKLTAIDSLALRKHMREHNPDVDMTFDFKCSECELERRLSVPIAPGFCFLTSLTPEEKLRIYTEMFHLVYNSNGGFTFEEVYQLPIPLRNFYIKLLIDQKTKESEQVKSQESRPATKSKVARPPTVKT